MTTGMALFALSTTFLRWAIIVVTLSKVLLKDGSGVGRLGNRGEKRLGAHEERLWSDRTRFESEGSKRGNAAVR